MSDICRSIGVVTATVLLKLSAAGCNNSKNGACLPAVPRKTGAARREAEHTAVCGIGHHMSVRIQLSRGEPVGEWTNRIVQNENEFCLEFPSFCCCHVGSSNVKAKTFMLFVQGALPAQRQSVRGTPGAARQVVPRQLFWKYLIASQCPNMMERNTGTERGSANT